MHHVVHHVSRHHPHPLTQAHAKLLRNRRHTMAAAKVKRDREFVKNKAIIKINEVDNDAILAGAGGVSNAAAGVSNAATASGAFVPNTPATAASDAAPPPSLQPTQADAHTTPRPRSPQGPSQGPPSQLSSTLRAQLALRRKRTTDAQHARRAKRKWESELRREAKRKRRAAEKAAKNATREEGRQVRVPKEQLVAGLVGQGRGGGSSSEEGSGSEEGSDEENREPNATDGYWGGGGMLIAVHVWLCTVYIVYMSRIVVSCTVMLCI